jgi:hypothetical protein
MSVIADSKYGGFEEPRPPTITQYGVATDLYGVTSDPYTDSLLLLETEDLLLQENSSNILLN